MFTILLALKKQTVINVEVWLKVGGWSFPIEYSLLLLIDSDVQLANELGELVCGLSLSSQDEEGSGVVCSSTG